MKMNVNSLQTGSITVTVLNGNDASPIQGATITATPGNYTCTTDTTGKCTISDIPAGGPYAITGTKTGYTGDSIGNVAVIAGQTTTATLLFTPITTGTIVCSTTPSNASVYLDGADTGFVTPVNITSVPAGSRTVTFKLTGYQDCSQTVTVVAGGVVNASCTLSPIVTTGSITVTVLNGNDASPIQGATITATPGNYTCTTDTTGKCTISDIPEPGPYTVAGTKSGYTGDSAGSIGIIAGQTTTLTLLFTPITTGTIVCSTTPSNASVYLDGADTGFVTPVNITSVPAGSRTVTFKLTGYQDCSQTVTVVAGGVVNASCTLTPSTGDIEFSTTPSGASVYIDGGLVPGYVTPVTITGVTSGSHNVTFKLTGYQDCSQTVTVIAGGSVNASCTLTPSTGDIEFSTTPSGASVYIDGALVPGYVTPVTITGVTSGSHNVTFKLTGYNDCSQTITVIAGGSVNASCTLTPSTVISIVSISPTTPTIIVGNTLQFSAICQDQNGNVIECPPPIWSVTDTNIGSITNTGLFTAIKSGTVTVQATIGLITGTTLATISPAAQAGFGAVGMVLVGGLIVGALYYMAIKPHNKS